MRENFPVASLLLPRAARLPVRAFYAFVRAADDWADDGSLPADVRRNGLDYLDQVLDGDERDNKDAPEPIRLAASHARDLRDCLTEAGLSLGFAHDLLAAFRLDTEKNRQRDWDDLMAGCALSAVPVGRFLVAVMGGTKGDAGTASADALSVALQVLNHLQDMKDDYRNLDRIYLPANQMVAEGADEEHLGGDRMTPELARVVENVLGRVDGLIVEASALPGEVRSFGLGLQAAVTVEIAKRLSEKLRRQDPLRTRVQLTGLEFAQAFVVGVVRGLWRRFFPATSVKRSGSSLAWGMRMQAPERREALYTVYGFCRLVDDIADDVFLGTAEKKTRLSGFRAAIEALFAGEPVSEPAVQALGGPVLDYGLEKADFLAVLDGVERDAAAKVRIESIEALECYCNQVASAVGRLANAIFGIEGKTGLRLAHVLGRAMQVTNILRDIAEDAARDRVYLPADMLVRHGIEGSNAEMILLSVGRSRVPEELARMADLWYAEADQLLVTLPDARARPVRVMMEAYRRILVRLRRRGWSRLNEAVRLGIMERLWIAVRYGLFHGKT